MFAQTIVRALLVAAFAFAPAAASARLIDPDNGAGGLDPAIATAVAGHGSVDAASIPLDPAIATALNSHRAARAPSIPLDPAIKTALNKHRAGTARPGFRISESRLQLGARAADQVNLAVYTRSIDGSLLFSTPTGWSWRCLISGSRTCSVNTARGQVITITAENGASSSFQGWDGACAGYGAQPACTLQVNDNQVAATARFSPLRLWLPAFGRGYISVERYPDGARLPSRSCGYECSDFANGERLRLRAVAAPGAHMSAWGGRCEGVPATHNCLVTMDFNKVVSATFEETPRSSTCPVNSSCDPVEDGTVFTVRVYGAGSVVAPKMRSFAELTCETNLSAGRSCPDFWRPKGEWIDLKAAPRYGGTFLGWGGVCSGTGTCHFRNVRRASGTIISARFG
jgi:hypothetical protein